MAAFVFEAAKRSAQIEHSSFSKESDLAMTTFQSVFVSLESSSEEEDSSMSSSSSSSASCCFLVSLLFSALLSTRFRNARSLFAIQVIRAFSFIGPSLFRTRRPLHIFCIVNAACRMHSSLASLIRIFLYPTARQHGHLRRSDIDSTNVSKDFKHCAWKQCAQDVNTCPRF